MKNIVIATVKSWNINNAHKLASQLKGSYKVHIITSTGELNLNTLEKIDPEFIFFPHWSWIIKEDIFLKYNCVVFHMTDLPFGRGGSPLQNLILEKVYQTKISALKVVQQLDAGPVYMKKELDISTGSAEEIFKKISEIVYSQMIPFILENNPEPVAQEGEPTFFRRRKPEQSNIENNKIDTMTELYDFVRMLDCEGYPRAYFAVGGLKVQLDNVKRENNKLVGKFEVITNE